MSQVKTGDTWKRQLVEHIGSAKDDTELKLLKTKADKRLDELKPQQHLPLWPGAESRADFQLSQPFAWGLWQVIGRIYDSLALPAGLLKYLVLARIALPKSKLATARYLENNLQYAISSSAIYKFMDSLSQAMVMDKLLAYARAKVAVEAGIISIVFYDVTTLYFENDQEDEDVNDGLESILGLRKYGYSKDHRADQPQVVIGLTVDGNGFPLDFQVYEGNTYEGNTLLKGVNQVSTKLSLTGSQLTVVADAGMLNAVNLKELEDHGYRYIVGARIKSMSEAQTKVVLDWDYVKSGSLDITLRAGQRQSSRRLIVTYSEFDGLRGYITNTALSVEDVVARYGNLWQVEKSFRMSKTDLKARPALHYKRQRIIAHLTICVAALAVLREFNQKLASLPTGKDDQPVGQSIALEQLLAIWQYQLTVKGKESFPIYSKLNELQEKLLNL
jgi:hypothetical protein